MKIEQNVGKNDKAVRFILGVIFAYLGYVYSAWLYIVAVGLLITSFTGYCLPYKWFKIRS